MAALGSNSGLRTAALKTFQVAAWLMAVAAVTTVLARNGFSPLTKAIVSCFLLAVTYVASLYVWPNQLVRDHPSTIKRRFVSVTVTTVLSPIFVFVFRADLDRSIPEKVGVAELLGIRISGLLQAIVLPLFLTMVLFAGPLLVQFLEGACYVYADGRYWASNARNLIWLRNHVVAPFSEEFTFRACMLPLLSSCLPYPEVIVACPLFFGVAHLHHLVERLRAGTEVAQAVAFTLFQFAYTTVFGAYSAFLFLRTGHLMAAFAVHAFCNHMGFPDFGETMRFRPTTRCLVWAAFVAGLWSWCLLLHPLTDPALYDNRLYRHLT